jgi:hypothetical protein
LAKHNLAMLIFTPDFEVVLSAGEMVDQCTLLKEMFSGRWPSTG